MTERIKRNWLERETFKLVRKPNKSHEEWQELHDKGLADTYYDTEGEIQFRLNREALGGDPQPWERANTPNESGPTTPPIDRAFWRGEKGEPSWLMDEDEIG